MRFQILFLSNVIQNVLNNTPVFNRQWTINEYYFDMNKSCYQPQY